MSAEPSGASTVRSRIASAFRGRKGAVLSVALVVWGLAAFDLTLLPRQNSVFLQALAAERLGGVRLAPDAMVLTSADPTTPAGPWVLTSRGDNLRVVGTQLPDPHNPHPPKNRVFHPALQMTVRHVGRPSAVDIDTWDRREPALFTVSAGATHPTLSVYSLRRPAHLLLRSAVPLPRQTSDRRDFFVARWSGPRPDLFVIDRNAQRRKPKTEPSLRRWSITVYSGESGFKHVIERSLLRKWLSRRLSKYAWWLDVAPSHHGQRPSLTLITRERRTGSGRTEIHIISGSSKLQNFSLHAPTALPQRLDRLRQFVFQPGREGGAVLVLEIDNGQLSLRAIPLP